MKKTVKVGKAKACPPNELWEPKKKFEDTFSAVTALKEHFGIKD